MKEDIHLKQQSSGKEKAILVAVQPLGQTEQQTSDYLDELAFLATTADIETKNFFIQKLEQPDARTFVKKGKLNEIKEFIEYHEIDTLIFDDDLSPAQVRNISQKIKDIRIIDRSLLILEIFSNRAQTAQSRLQVELAQYQYLYPRLTRMWTHHSRQRGGTGQRGGPGEKELETDRRLVRDRIAFLKKKLAKQEKQAEERRKNRGRMVRAVLVGYTNVGKSSLMNRLTKSGVFAEDKLFATVDSTVRRLVIRGIPFLLTDTVGFIRKLPTHLIESFKSTLEEIREAQIIIHVVDGSHPAVDEQIKVVNEILEDLDSKDKPTLLVLNKMDLVDNTRRNELDFMLSDLPKNQKGLFVSAKDKEGLKKMREMLGAVVQQEYVKIYPNEQHPQGYHIYSEWSE